MFKKLVSSFKPVFIRENIFLQSPLNLIFKVPERSKTKKFLYPVLYEGDLKERHVKGFGPGGQCINKTNSCVVLKHLPTGIVVKCQPTRFLEENRKLARQLMQARLDWHENREGSQVMVQRAKASAEKEKKKAKTREKLEKLKEFKLREGIT